MTTLKFDKVIDTIQSGLVWFVVFIITICIAVLFLFDVLAGTGTMLYLTDGKEWQSVVISIATTGLLFALMFIGYIMTTGSKNRLFISVGKGIMLISGIIYLQDVIFDSLLADILRYGTVVNAGKDWLQWMFRGTIGGISTVGDALAIAMVTGMPVLKAILREALQGEIGSQSVGNTQQRSPQNQQRPVYNQTAPQMQGIPKKSHGEENVPEFLKAYQAKMNRKPGQTNKGITL